MEIAGYEIGEAILRDHHFAMHRGRRIGSGAPVLLKVHSGSGSTGRLPDALAREFALLRSLSIPGVPHAHDLVSSAEGPCLVLEDRGLRPLADLTARGPLDLPAVFRIGGQLFFGSDRVRDFPVSENLMTAAAMGAALTGLRPVIVHQRLDFMIYSLDAIVNWLSLWRFKSNGHSGLPVTIRAIVGKGWGQGPQHSKSLHAWFAHLPGLRVAVPATAYDAKGLLLESIFSEDPAVFVEGRSLFSMTTEVPEQPYRIRFGQAAVRRRGKDLTLVAIGNQVPLALRHLVVVDPLGAGVAEARQCYLQILALIEVLGESLHDERALGPPGGSGELLESLCHLVRQPHRLCDHVTSKCNSNRCTTKVTSHSSSSEIKEASATG